MQHSGNSKWLLCGLAAFASLALAAEVKLVDPTRPYKTDGYEQHSSQPANRYNLNSTLFSSNRRVAVINGIYVTEGETVGDATVISIRKHAVTLQTSNRQITLQLLPDIVKRHPVTMEIQP